MADLVTVAGIDYSTRFVDIVMLEEDSDRATWHRFELEGSDAFERARHVRAVMRPIHGSTPINGFWDDTVAIGIEQPRGHHGTVHLARIQGAILSCLPPWLLVQPWNPSQWRKACGIPGNASKEHVQYGIALFLLAAGVNSTSWPQDAHDAYGIAYATRQALEHTAAA